MDHNLRSSMNRKRKALMPVPHSPDKSPRIEVQQQQPRVEVQHIPRVDIQGDTTSVVRVVDVRKFNILHGFFLILALFVI